MTKKTKYTDEKLGEVEIVEDFLPRPEELGFKDANVKVTLNLSRSSVDFFKKIARQNGSRYQKVIRELLDTYSSHFSSK